MSVSVSRRGSQKKPYWQRKVVQIQNQQKVQPDLHRVATEQLLSEVSANQSTEMIKPEQFRMGEVRKKHIVADHYQSAKIVPQEYEVLKQHEAPGNYEYFESKKSPKEQQFLTNFTGKGPVFNRNRGVAKRAVVAQKAQKPSQPSYEPIQQSEVFKMSMNPAITNAHNNNKKLKDLLSKQKPIVLPVAVAPETLVQRSTQKYSELRKLLQNLSGPSKTRSPKAINSMKKMSILHPSVNKTDKKFNQDIVLMSSQNQDSKDSDGQSSIYMVEEEVQQTMSDNSVHRKDGRRNILMKKSSNIVLSRPKCESPAFTNRIGNIRSRLGKKPTTTTVSSERVSRPQTKRLSEENKTEMDETKYLVGNKERFGQSFFKVLPSPQIISPAPQRVPIQISSMSKPTVNQLQNPHFFDKPITQVRITKNRNRQPPLMVMKSTRMFKETTLSKISSKSNCYRSTSQTPIQISEGTDPILCQYEDDDNYIDLEQPKIHQTNILAGPVPVASGYSTGESFHPSTAGTRQISPVPSQVVLNRNLIKQRRNRQLYLHSSFQSQKSTNSNDQLQRAMAIGRRILQIAPGNQRASVSILDNDYNSAVDKHHTQKSTYSGGSAINPVAKYNQLQNCSVKVNQENVNKKSLKFQQLQLEKLNQSQPIWLNKPERRCQSTMSGALVTQMRSSLPNIGSVSSRTHLHEKNSTVPEQMASRHLPNKNFAAVGARALFPIVKMQL